MKKILVVLFVLLTVCSLNALAQTEEKRIERLSDLARVWGTVKYLHPYLAYKEVDWDKALIETIPKVNAAKNKEEYKAAVNSMLAHLKDDATSIIDTAPEPDPQSKPKTDKPKSTPTEAIRLEKDVLVIDLGKVYSLLDGDFQKEAAIQARLAELQPQAKSVLFDLRFKADYQDYNIYSLIRLFPQAIQGMLDSNISKSSLRFREHSGYATQVGLTSGGYYSALITSAPQTLSATGKKTLPMYFAVAEDPFESDLLAGLQSAGKAFILTEEGQKLDNSIGVSQMKLKDGLSLKMRIAEVVLSDGSVGFYPNYTIKKGESIASIVDNISQNKIQTVREKKLALQTGTVGFKDETYPAMQFPSAEYRLLALFRFWNIINFFFPYKQHIDRQWADVLPKYIPKLEANKDAGDYQLTVREMVAEIQDSHGFVGGALQGAEKLGLYYPPFVTKFIQGQSVVISVADEKIGIKAGDVILKVDDETIEQHRARLGKYVAASTPQSLQRSINTILLRGQKDTKLRLEVRGQDGKIRTVETVRSIIVTDQKVRGALSKKRETPVFQVLPSGFGYVDLDRLPGSDVDKMFETLKDTKAIIFDMRGYPQGTAWQIAPRLTEKKNPIGASFSRMNVTASSFGNPDYATGQRISFEQPLPDATGFVYKGKVVMLIDESAVSQSEHTCLFFKAATNVTFIGTPTMGANGDVTSMVLPGGLTASFSGHAVRHPDGKQLQRVGIQPDIRVEPTIKGFLAGKDEILEAAVKYLQKKK